MSSSTLTPITPADRRPTAVALSSPVAIYVENNSGYELALLTSANTRSHVAPYGRTLYNGLDKGPGLTWLLLSPKQVLPVGPNQTDGTVSITTYSSTSDTLPAAGSYKLGNLLMADVKYTDVDLPGLGVASLNLRQFGAVGDGTTDDWAAFNAAVTVADVLGGDVYIPRGNFAMTIPASGAAIATGPVRIRGAGAGITKITALNGSLAANTAMIAPASGTTVTIEDLTVVGPSTPNSFASYLVQHQGGSSGRLTVRRCTISSFIQPIEARTNCGLLVVDSCDLTGQGLAPANALVNILDGVKARIINSYFHSFGISGSNQMHGIYATQSVDLEVVGCTFDNNQGTTGAYCIHNNGGSGNSPNYAIIDCYFNSDAGRGILTNGTVRTRVIGCRFTSPLAGVAARFDVDVQSCQFSNASPTESPIVLSQASSKGRVKACSFILPSTGTYAATLAQDGSVWRFDSCYFGCNRAYAVNTSGTSKYFLGLTNEYLDDGPGHWSVGSNATAPTLSGVNANVINQSVSGDDAHGVITFDVQTSSIASAATLFVVNFGTAYANAPIVLLTNMVGNNTAIPYNASVVGTSSFQVRTGGSLVVNTAYKIGYIVIGQ